MRSAYSRFGKLLAGTPALVAVGACSGIQSALDPKGVQAARVASLTWFLVGFRLWFM
jgi:hypothetical protein